MAGYLAELLDGRRVASSRLPRKTLDTLIDENLVFVSSRGSKKTIRVRDAEALRRFLIDNDERFRLLDIEGSSHTRSEQASMTGNCKLSVVRSCPGFPVNTAEPIECTLGSRSLTISPTGGTFLFVCDWETLRIPEDVVVVGIENMENFRLAGRQLGLFRSVLGDSRLLFASRYPQSCDLRRWLQSIPNRYVHFGDFDLAGIRIFQTEFERHLGGRASYLIPSDVEDRIRCGSAKRYNDQFCHVGNISSDNPKLQSLIDIINRHRKGYDQEGYIE